MHSETTQIVSRSGGWRLRWIAAAIAAPLFGVVAAFGTVRDTPEPIPIQTIVEPLDLSAALIEEARPVSYFQEDRFQRNHTAAALLDRLGAAEGEAANVLRSSQAARSLRLLQPGTMVGAKTAEHGTLRSLWFFAGGDTLVR